MFDAPVDVREAGRDSRRDMARDVARDVRPDLRPDVSRDLPLDMPTDGIRDSRADGPRDSGLDGAPPACTPFATTTTLAVLEHPALSSTLVLAGDKIFVGTSKNGTETAAPVNAIVEISISSQTSKTYPLGSDIPAWLAAGDHSIFFMKGKSTYAGAGSWSFSYPDIARLELATGQVSVIDHELVPWGYTILSVVGNANGEVFWSMLANAVDSTTVIRRWDRPTSSVKTVMTVEQAATLHMNSDRLYWSGTGLSGVAGFFSAPLTGGLVSTVVEWPDENQLMHTLLAVDEKNIYYLMSNSSNGTMAFMPKQGGTGQRIALVASPSAVGSRTIDDTHLYWVDYSNQKLIRRVPKDGGAMELFPIPEVSSIADLVVDRCNVYWIDAGNSRLMAKGK